MRQQSSLWRLAVASVGLLVCAAVGYAQQSTPCDLTLVRACVHLRDDSQLLPTTPAPLRRLPVLFVHGHNSDNAQDADFNYRKNWQDPSRLSFKPTLELNANAGLDVEDYYIRFEDQGHSISEDATDISDAIDLILHRHDPGYAYPHVPGQTSHVKVVIIAYSKGTLSSRLYLKSLGTTIAGMPPARPGFNPVSEFIALAPPNHGIATALGTTCAGQQMMNGRSALSCRAFGEPLTSSPQPCGSFPAGGLNFITDLNTPDEAPGSRAATDNSGAPTPPSRGTLYVTIFADASNPDFVGGENDPGTCQSRPMASNRSSNAVNIPVAITGANEVEVHRNTPHTALVICKALFAAVHHRSPRTEDCSLAPDAVNPPIIPLPPRAAAMLSLDFSGSMSISTGPNATRASALKEAVRLFIELWSVVSVPSDRIGVNYFSTNVRPFPASGDPLLPLFIGGPAIIADLDNQSPGGMTAMGNGLQQAIQVLTDSASDAQVRRVILFTDGIQNVNPIAQIVNDQLTFVNETGRPNSNVSPTAPTFLDPSLGIAVDTIGIGAGETFVGRLEEIADKTNGHTKTTTDIDLLRQFFVEELIDALKGFSPQLVAYRRGAVAAKGSAEAFAIEDGVRKLVLKTSWKRGDSLDFSVVKDGVDVTSSGRFINGDFYKIFVVDLPAKGPITARGNWQMQIKGNAGTAYEAAAIVDGSPIAYDSNFSLKRPRAGEPLELVVRLTAGGQPISETAKVFVTLMSPTFTAGDVIAKKPLKELPVFEPGMSIAERQLLALAQDPKRSALLKPKLQKLVLEPTGKGEFRARLSTRVPGIYTAFVTIEGSDPKFGQFSRTMTTTTAVRFANADRKATEIFVSECDAVGGRWYVRVFLSPRDASGHYMGPGSASDISLELSNGRMVGSTRDFGDGSYALLFEVPPSDDPTVTLKVAGAVLFTGRLSQLSQEFR